MADWKVQLGMHLKMCNNRSERGRLKSYWYSFSLLLRYNKFQKYF